DGKTPLKIFPDAYKDPSQLKWILGKDGKLYKLNGKDGKLSPFDPKDFTRDFDGDDDFSKELRRALDAKKGRLPFPDLTGAGDDDWRSLLDRRNGLRAPYWLPLDDPTDPTSRANVDKLLKSGVLESYTYLPDRFRKDKAALEGAIQGILTKP